MRRGSLLSDDVLKQADWWLDNMKTVRKIVLDTLTEVSFKQGTMSDESTEFREFANQLRDLELSICTLTAENLNGAGLIRLKEALVKADNIVIKLNLKAEGG